MVKYDLYYLNMRGRAELLRLIFHASRIEFNDNQCDFKDFEKFKSESPLDALPWLKVDNVKIPQSMAAARYLAREFKLDGTDSLEKAQVDAIVDTLCELFNSVGFIMFKIPDAEEKVISLLIKS
jgi:glutathione S-transferase